MMPGNLVLPAVAALIQAAYPEWTEASAVCLEDLHRLRIAHVREVLAAERGEITELEQNVLHSLEHQEPLAEDVVGDFEENLSLGARMADRIATFGGSWTFILIFGGVIVVWMFINTVLLITRPFDPYPFILLNLVLSCLAALQAPVIMMSQNRQEAKDRIHAEHDYQVNLKAELEVRHLHEKLDHMLIHQWQRLIELQEIQIELMEEVVRGKGRDQG